jgi:hypothetical protein
MRLLRRPGHSPATPGGDIDEELPQELRWLTEMLWQRSGLVVAVTTGPPSGRELESYTVVPRASRPRFLLPMASGRVTASALIAYNAIRPWPARFSRLAVASAFRAGLGPRLFPDRVAVTAPKGMPIDTARSRLLCAHLEEILGMRGIKAAIGVRRPGVFGKPTLQLFTPDGRPAAYAKVGWSDLTRQLIRAEAAALRAWELRPSPLIGVPRLLHHGSWEDLSVSVTAPLPAKLRRYRPEHVPPPAEVSRAVASLHGGARSMPLAQSSYWRAVRHRAADADGRVHDLVGRLECEYADVTLAFGAWHGDWVPWNLASFEGRIYAWDWEQSGQEVPVGFDVLQFHFQRSFIARREELARAVARCRRQAGPMLAEMQVPTERMQLVLVLYLLETYLRYLWGVRSGNRWLRRFYPGILAVLQDEASALTSEASGA